MPKAILEFNLPEEEYEFDKACKASTLQFALEDVRDILRSKVKYCELTAEQYKLAEEIYKKFIDIMLDRNIEI